MDVLDLILHTLNFVAPAWFLALGVVSLVRFWPQAGLGASSFSWSMQVMVQGLAGSSVLIAGLALLGVDGKMVTYIGLVCMAATMQWLLCRSWRR